MSIYTKMSSQEKVAQHIAESVDWCKFVSFVRGLGKQLNDKQHLPLKGRLIEMSVDAYSQGKMKYIGGNGCDFITDIDGVEHTIEMKFMDSALYTPKRKQEREYTKSITLFNSRGTNKRKALPDYYADYLLVVELNAAALIQKKHLHKYCTFSGADISVKIPTNLMTTIFTPYEVEDVQPLKMDLKKQMDIMFLNFILKAYDKTPSASEASEYLERFNDFRTKRRSTLVNFFS